ncbi:DHA2 family efflux MFS transporter permease subunit [Pendulispora rubella]|uniref:DHA2 family efflux MFS transporter permease subunit n=1 Tax=Pendulispora rubella TaxID=2741070 RepID=A0ABZ2LA96_9BACT
MATNTTDPASRRRWIALFAVLLGQFMLVLDATIVNVALPVIQADLHLPEARLTWVTNAYLLAYGGLLLLFGRLGDLFGRRRMFLFGLALFTAASVACGMTHHELVLIAARFVQGVGAAAASSVVLAIVAIEFPEAAARTKAMSGYMFVSISGGSVGLLVGGAITQMLDWHWIFLVNLPIGVLSIPLARAVLREDALDAKKGSVDVAGAVLVTASAMSLVYALVTGATQPWTSPAVLVPAIGTAVLLAVFFVLESRVAHPILPLRILRIRSLMVGNLVRGLLMMGMYGVFFFGSLELWHALGFGPMRVGLAFLPMTGMVGLMSLGISARLVARFGPRPVLVAGMSLVVLAVASFARLDPHASYWPWRLLSFAVLGLGAGNSFLPLLTIAMSDVPARDAGLGSAMVTLSLQLAGAIDLAILATAASHRTATLRAMHLAPMDAVLGGYHFAYQVALGGVVLGLLAAAFLLAPAPKQVKPSDKQFDGPRISRSFEQREALRR